MFKILFIIGFLLSGCQQAGSPLVSNQKSLPDKTTALYKICDDIYRQKSMESPLLLAGHVYGNHNDSNLGLYPPFLDVLESKSIKNVKKIALLGDLVRDSNKADSYTEIKVELQPFEVIAVPGNHDNTDQLASLFNERFGLQDSGRTRIIWIDTTIAEGEIEGEQLNLIISALTVLPVNIEKVLILTHHLIWADPDKVNYQGNGGFKFSKLDSYDYGQLAKIIQISQVPVVVISGDAGAFAGQPSYSCFQENNGLFLSTGMGGGELDNFLLFDLESSKISISLNLF